MHEQRFRTFFFGDAHIHQNLRVWSVAMANMKIEYVYGRIPERVSPQTVSDICCIC